MSGGRFDVCIGRVLVYEVGGQWATGGYSDYPADPGGETKWGISKRAHPNLDIKNLTIEQAKGLYFKEYWTPASCFAFPPPFDLFVLDAAVHNGPSSAIKQAQRALRVTADGVVGSETIKAAAALKPGIASIGRFLVERADVLRRAPAADTYFKGWIARVLDLNARAALEIA